MMRCCLLNLRVSTLVLATMGLQWLVINVIESFSISIIRTVSLTLVLFLQFAFNMEQGIPVLPEWLFFNRVNTRARKDVEIGPARFLLRCNNCYEFLVGIKFLKMH